MGFLLCALGSPLPYPLFQLFNIPDMPSADELLPYLRRIDTARWYTNFGPLVVEFEAAMQRHLTAMEKPGRPPIQLATLITCYHALAIGLQVMNVPAAPKVLIPAITFPACPLAVQRAGGVPVLADIDPGNWRLTPEIARRICAKSKIDAVMPVAVYGVPVPVAPWDQFTRDTGIPVIIDAAAALDTQEIPEQCLVAFSLHATKPFGIGEGGILACRNPDQIDEARLISNFGMCNRVSVRDGSNAKMSEYHAAVALAQLARWPQVKQKRRDRLSAYQTALTKHQLDVTLQPGIENAVVSSLMLKLAKPIAPQTVAQLQSEGVAAHRTYLPPLYDHPNFAGLPLASADGTLIAGATELAAKTRGMAGAEHLTQTLMGLPFHNFLTPEEIDTSVQVLKHLLG